jgi:protoporphyrinogen oxidase
LRVGIIGAGATGLATAYQLGKHGHRVAVYERAPFLGGQASTFDVGGARLERGYHHLFTGDTDILDLIRQIGLGHQIRYIESKVGTLYDGKIYDFVTPIDLLKFTPLSLLDRLRLGLMTLRLRRMKDWRPLESFTADEWLRRKAGRRGYEVFWGPMLRGKFGDDFYDQVGMAWIWGKIHTRFASRGKGLAKEMLVYPIGSFGEVFDVLAQRIAEQGNEVHTSASVSRVVVEAGRATGLEVELHGQEPSLAEFDAVVVTTPSYIFPKLLPPLPEEYLSRLTHVSYMAAVLVILVLDRPLSHVYWLNVADRSIPFVGVIEQTNLIGPEHYGGNHIVYLANYLTAGHRLFKMDHEELLQEYLPHLRKINPDFQPSWIQTSYHHRVDAAQPIIGVNYSSHMPDHRTPFKGVYLANTTQVYPEDRGTNYSVRMGNHVARLVMDDFSP